MLYPPAVRFVLRGHEVHPLVAPPFSRDRDVPGRSRRRRAEGLAKLEAVADRHTAEYQDWLEHHRNVTAHFPELVREAHEHGAEQLANALARAADFPGDVTLPGSDKTLRFHYADTVAVNLLPDVTANPTAIKELATALIAMSRFVGAAFVAYAQAHPEAFSLEP